MNIENKYDIKLNTENIKPYLNLLVNKIYKLLPLKEEGLDWKKYLESILIELSGLSRITGTTPTLLCLLSKLESLYELDSFALYRKTIFECLNLVDEIYA